MSGIARVAESEAQLLSAVRAVLSPNAPPPELRLRLFRCSNGPPSLGPTARRLLEDTLRDGCVLELARRGGWRARGKAGRLWQRHPELELHFTRSSYALCQWLAYGVAPSAPPETAADHLLYYLAATAGLRAGLPSGPLFTSSLACLTLLEPTGTLAQDLRHFMAAPGGAIVMEALEQELAERWQAIEEEKWSLGSPRQVLALSERQDAVLTALVDAALAEDRPQLLGSIVVAGAGLQSEPAARWSVRLAEATAPLSERSAAITASTALLRAIERVGSVRERLARVPFFDEEDYARAQALLAAWEVLGATGFARIQGLRAEIESLRALTSPAEVR